MAHLLVIDAAATERAELVVTLTDGRNGRRAPRR
jgi:hypothetical protein